MAAAGQIGDVHLFIVLVVALCQLIQSFDSRHIGDAAFCKIDDDLIRIVSDVKLGVKYGSRAKEKGTINFVMLDTIFIDPFPC